MFVFIGFSCECLQQLVLLVQLVKNGLAMRHLSTLSVCMYVCMYVCMHYVYMSFPQMRHCNIAPLHQLGICHNNVTVDNTFPTCFGGVQVGIQNK